VSTPIKTLCENNYDPGQNHCKQQQKEKRHVHIEPKKFNMGIIGVLKHKE